MRIHTTPPWIFLAGLALLLTACGAPETTSPRKKTIEDAVFASGSIEQENNYTVSAKVEGIVISLPVKEGDSVTRGQLIAQIESDVQGNQLQDAVAVYNDAKKNAAPDSPKLQQLQTQIEQAQAQLALDKANYERYKVLREKNSVSQLDLDKAELQYKAAQNSLDVARKSYQEAENSLKLSVKRSQMQVNTQRTLLQDYNLTTGVSGKVINVFKKQGELVRRGEALATIASGAYTIKLLVSEDDITQIDLQDPVAVNLNTYPDRTFMAKVTRIYPGFDLAEQSYVLEAQFDELPDKMFSGTQVQANIETGSREEVLVIPVGYVFNGNQVELEGGEVREIVTGGQNREWIEVVSGLSETDVIIKPKD